MAHLKWEYRNQYLKSYRYREGAVPSLVPMRGVRKIALEDAKERLLRALAERGKLRDEEYK